MALQTQKEKVVVGQEAPDFVLQDHFAKDHRLRQYRGRKVWLSFFRYAACPVCNLRIDEMKAWTGVFNPEKTGLAVLTVFQSSVMTVAQYVGKQNPPFPLLCDPKEEIYFNYGLEHGGSILNPNVLSRGIQAGARGFLGGTKEGRINRLPGDFLIDEDGIVQEIHKGRDWADHIDFKQVEAFLGKPR